MIIPNIPKGQTITIVPGLTATKNTRNEFTVLTLHYSAHPDRQPGTPQGNTWINNEMRKLGCYRICKPCDSTLSIQDDICPECQNPTDLILSNRWRREHEIDYSAHSGSFVFDSFSRGRNTCEPFRIPPSWKRFRSIDYGYRNPTAVLWIALDHDNHSWVYHEYYQQERTTDYHARQIHTISATIDQHTLQLSESDLREILSPSWQPDPNFRRKIAATYKTIGDPSMDRRTQREMNTIIKRFAQNHVYIKKANNSMAGIETIQNAFANNTCTIFNTCTTLISEIENLVWAEHQNPAKNQKERPVDRNDHGVDCLRYYFNEFAPQPQEQPDQEPKTPENIAYQHRNP